MAQTEARQYAVQARSTEIFGRVLCSSRHHHFIVDGPVQNGCPGEALTPVELFLASVAACGVELLEVFARQRKLPLKAVRVEIWGALDPRRRGHPDFTLFKAVRLEFTLTGVTAEQGAQLVTAFKGR
jgi:uncharacterized OsmC-like protein